MTDESVLETTYSTRTCDDRRNPIPLQSLENSPQSGLRVTEALPFTNHTVYVRDNVRILRNCPKHQHRNSSLLSVELLAYGVLRVLYFSCCLQSISRSWCYVTHICMLLNQFLWGGIHGGRNIICTVTAVKCSVLCDMYVFNMIYRPDLLNRCFNSWKGENSTYVLG